MSFPKLGLTGCRQVQFRVGNDKILSRLNWSLSLGLGFLRLRLCTPGMFLRFCNLEKVVGVAVF